MHDALKKYEIKTLRHELESTRLKLEQEEIKTQILLDRVNNVCTEKDKLHKKVDTLQAKIDEFTIGIEAEVSQNFTRFTKSIEENLNEFREEFKSLCSADVLVGKLEPKVAMMINTLIYQQEKRQEKWFEENVLPLVTEAASISHSVGIVSKQMIKRADCEKQREELTNRLMQKKTSRKAKLQKPRKN